MTKDIDTKIDDLSQAVENLTKVVTNGFVEVNKEIDDLAQMTACGFTEMGARVSHLEEICATKEDLKHLQGNVDIMLDKHIGEFRKDYDTLAVRMKDLELA